MAYLCISLFYIIVKHSYCMLYYVNGWTNHLFALHDCIVNDQMLVFSSSKQKQKSASLNTLLGLTDRVYILYAGCRK